MRCVKKTDRTPVLRVTSPNDMVTLFYLSAAFQCAAR
jgi:hypothetical protein